MGNMDVLAFDALNGLRFALDLSLSVVFARFLYLNRQHLPRLRFGMNQVHAALAFFIMMFGEAGWRGFVWWYHGDARTAFIFTPLYALFMLFGVVAAIGTVCCLRVLLPEWWSWPTWLAITAFVVMVVIYTVAGFA